MATEKRIPKAWESISDLEQKINKNKTDITGKISKGGDTITGTLQFTAPYMITANNKMSLYAGADTIGFTNDDSGWLAFYQKSENRFMITKDTAVAGNLRVTGQTVIPTGSATKGSSSYLQFLNENGERMGYVGKGNAGANNDVYLARQSGENQIILGENNVSFNKPIIGSNGAILQFSPYQRLGVANYSCSTSPECVIIKTNLKYNGVQMPIIDIIGRGLFPTGYTQITRLRIGSYYYNNAIYVPTMEIDCPSSAIAQDDLNYCRIINIDGNYCISLRVGYCCSFTVNISNVEGTYSSPVGSSTWEVVESTKANIDSFTEYRKFITNIAFNQNNCPTQKSANGYCKFANGIIMQWGVFNGTGAGGITITLPTAFTSTNYTAQTTWDCTTSYCETAIQVWEKTTSSIRIGGQANRPTGNIHWLAIGY